MKKIHVQYGCGLSAPENWINFDASPTLRLQRMPLVGKILSSKLEVTFPSNVRYGDITKGLPGIQESSCDSVYCSHVLEHLSLNDFRIAIANTYKILKPEGIFRCVVPDLEVIARAYIHSLNNRDSEASIKFVNNTLLGVRKRDKGVKSVLTSALGNSHHLWMWDHFSLKKELEKAGFRAIRKCSYNDSVNQAFKEVEDISRFESAVALECIK